jgi:hypothetical protein
MKALVCFAIFAGTFQGPSMALMPQHRINKHQGNKDRLFLSQSNVEACQESAIDWNTFNLKQQYKKCGGILYKQSLLTPEEYNDIMIELSNLDLNIQDEMKSSFANKRMGCTIGRETDIYRILTDENGSLLKLVTSLEDDCNGRLMVAPDIPVEVSLISVIVNDYNLLTVHNQIVLTMQLRIYEKTGAGMEWHFDDILYNPSQIEVVVTIENSSDCCTMWKPLIGHIQSVQTTPNSGLILKSGGVEHKVSPLRVGRRTILKLAFVREGATLLDDMIGHAGHHSGKNKKKKRKR